MYRFLPLIHTKVVSETVLGAVVNDRLVNLLSVLIHDSTEQYKVQYSTGTDYNSEKDFTV